MVMQPDPLRQFRPIAAKSLDDLRRPAGGSVGSGPLAYDVYLCEDEVVIEFDVPGISSSDLVVSLEDRTLVVEARRELDRRRPIDIIDTGRPHGQFSRRLFVGDRWDMASTTAELHDGVLTVRAGVRMPTPVHEVFVSGDTDRGHIDVGPGRERSAEACGDGRPPLEVYAAQ
jgi:HSP20 family protein